MEELKKLRAAEESAMTALVDEEMTARFSGDVTLTVRDTPTVLSPEQVGALPLSCASTPRTSTLLYRKEITCALHQCQISYGRLICTLSVGESALGVVPFASALGRSSGVVDGAGAPTN